jgi:hypothetical protein
LDRNGRVVNATIIDFGQSRYQEDIIFTTHDVASYTRADLEQTTEKKNWNYMVDARQYSLLFYSNSFYNPNMPFWFFQLLSSLQDTTKACDNFDEIVDKLEREIYNENVLGNESLNAISNSPEYLVDIALNSDISFILRRQCFMILATKTKLEDVFLHTRNWLLLKTHKIDRDTVQFIIDFLSRLFVTTRFSSFVELLTKEFEEFSELKEQLSSTVMTKADNIIEKLNFENPIMLVDTVLSDYDFFLSMRSFMDGIFHKNINRRENNQKIREILFDLEAKYFALSQSMVLLFYQVVPVFKRIEYFKNLAKFLAQVFHSASNSTEYYDRLTVVNFLPQMHKLLYKGEREQSILDDSIKHIYFDEVFKKAIYQSEFPELRNAAIHALGLLSLKSITQRHTIIHLLQSIASDKNASNSDRTQAVISLNKIAARLIRSSETLTVNSLFDLVDEGKVLKNTISRLLLGIMNEDNVDRDSLDKLLHIASEIDLATDAESVFHKQIKKIISNQQGIKDRSEDMDKEEEESEDMDISDEEPENNIKPKNISDTRNNNILNDNQAKIEKLKRDLVGFITSPVAQKMLPALEGNPSDARKTLRVTSMFLDAEKQNAVNYLITTPGLIETLTTRAVIDKLINLKENDCDTIISLIFPQGFDWSNVIKTTTTPVNNRHANPIQLLPFPRNNTNVLQINNIVQPSINSTLSADEEYKKGSYPNPK